MSINFKARIRNRYKGRGNCWVKVPNDSPAYQSVLNTTSDVNAKEYISHIEREGFAWVRFAKPAGSESEPPPAKAAAKWGSKKKTNLTPSVLQKLSACRSQLPRTWNTRH